MYNAPQSSTQKNRYENLLTTVSANDTLGILIVADPDAVASALALKRLFWRRAKKIIISRVNAINRSDNLAMLRCLHINLPYINQVKDTDAVTKWAIVDSQPQHHKGFGKYDLGVIIDHHPPLPDSTAAFMDIREEYGATSSIMTEYLRSAAIVPSPKLATALFYGIKTDTDNFARSSSEADIKAFRYLYPYVNLNIIRKIESSEINKKNLDNFRTAFENLQFIGDTAYIHMGEVDNADALVIIADFFLKMVEAGSCMVSGIYGKKIIIIIRNAAFRRNAGKLAQRLFGDLGSAGGHKDAARAEIPVDTFISEVGGLSLVHRYISEKIK